MKLDELQTYVSGRLMAVPALAALGAPICYSLFTDDKISREAIASSLETTGVCIEIGLPEAHEKQGASSDSRSTLLEAEFEVFIAESPKVAHVPENMGLVNQVVAAIRVRSAPFEQVPNVTSYMPAKSENGYILHVVSFTVPVILQ
jgi:hypothetical protein